MATIHRRPSCHTHSLVYPVFSSDHEHHPVVLNPEHSEPRWDCPDGCGYDRHIDRLDVNSMIDHRNGRVRDWKDDRHSDWLIDHHNDYCHD